MVNYVVVFPGQGSQHLGMLSLFYKKYDIVQKTFTEASNVLNYDLWNLVKNGPISNLNNTIYTQPAILTSSVAIWRILIKNKILMPKLLIGHSLGEYSALVCANSIDFSTAIKLVKLRGIYMQNIMHSNKYTMSVINGLTHSSVILACLQESQKQIVYPVNFNSPKQIVITGHKEAVYRTMIFCKKLGAKHVKLLSVSVPSHCNLTKFIAKKFSIILKNITLSKPKIPIINNANINIETNSNNIKKLLIKQFYTPIFWNKIVKILPSFGIKLLLEIGPSKILTTLTKKNNNSISCIAVNNPNSLILAINKYIKIRK